MADNVDFLLQQLASAQKNPGMRGSWGTLVAQLAQAVAANPRLAYKVGESLAAMGIDRNTQNVILNSAKAGGGTADAANARVGSMNRKPPPSMTPNIPQFGAGVTPKPPAQGNPTPIGDMADTMTGIAPVSGESSENAAIRQQALAGVNGKVYDPSTGGTTYGGGTDPATGLPVNFDAGAMDAAIGSAPNNAYFKDATGSTLGEVTPGFTQSEAENNPAWQYYLAKSGLRDTYAEDSLKDDFMAAEMVQRLLGGGDINGQLNPVDQLYGTQQLMGNLTSPGKFMNPKALMDAMFSKVENIQDPQMQMTYINGALAAMKPYMSSTDYMNMQTEVARQAENYLVKGVDNPSQEKDFLGMLQGIR